MNALMLTIVISQPSPVPRAPEVPQLRESAPKYPTFADAYESARGTDKTIMLFVGKPARAVKEVDIVAYEKTFRRADGTVETNAVAVIRRGRAVWYRDGMPESERQALVDALFAETEVSRAAVPFESSFARPSDTSSDLRTADDKPLGRGPWPKKLVFQDGLMRYRPAKFTQSLFKATGVGGAPAWYPNLALKTTRDGGQITREPRTVNEVKYQVPGGMVGVKGWTSDLYKFVPESPKVWVDFISVKQGAPLGGYQNEYGLRRSYQDGTYFVDVLSNQSTGEIFEARVREKHDGKWDSYVAYKNIDARPAGYHGLKVSCASCHESSIEGPGTGGYGSGLVAGGDTVISDGFTELELTR